MKMKMRRLLGIFLSLALMLGLMPGMAMTTYADDVSSWESGDCTVTYGNGTLTVSKNSGDGKMADYDENNPAPWNNNIENTNSVVIENGVTGIGNNAFRKFTLITSLFIADTVTNIGDGAFFGSNKLTSIKIPASVTRIGESAFYSSECTKIVAFIRPTTEGTLKIESGAFYTEDRLMYFANGYYSLYNGENEIQDRAKIYNYNGKTLTWKTKYKTMTVSAEDVKAAYDGKAHGITVNVTDPDSGAEIKYGKSKGTYDLTASPTITEVNDSPLTVYFKVTAEDYIPYTGSAIVTINKAAASAATVTANNSTYDGTEKELLSVDNSTLDGGKMQYALGTDKKTAPSGDWTTSIPTGTEAKTYYVWYMVKCDENYDDTEPECVEVIISENEVCTVTFEVQGHGTAPDDQTVEKDSYVNKPEDPAEEGFTFDGWFKEKECTNEWKFDSDKVTANITLYAKWTENDKPQPTPTDTGVKLNVSEITIAQGRENALKATTVPEGNSITWTSSDNSVAYVDASGVVTGLKAGTATITAKITVDGKEYTASCKVTVVPTGSPIIIPSAGGEHTHKYVWDTIEATEDMDGELRYQCETCCDIKERVPLTAYNIFNKNTTEKIRKAPKDSTVEIETNKWISFHKMVMEALAERPDVTLEITFLDEGHKGTRYKVVIPKGTDTKALVDKNGFTGFLFLGGKFGMTPQ